MKVLIADDSRLMRDRIRGLLKSFQNIEIIYETDSGLQALDAMTRMNPCIAIIDIRMQDMNGLNVIREYRKKKSNTVIVVLTNFANDHYRVNALEYGADYFLSKSEDFEKISSIVSEQLIIR